MGAGCGEPLEELEHSGAIVVAQETGACALHMQTALLSASLLIPQGWRRTLSIRKLSIGVDELLDAYIRQ